MYLEFSWTVPGSAVDHKETCACTYHQLVNHDFVKVLANAIKDLPQYALMERAEPAVSTLDEKKQLRMPMVDVLARQPRPLRLMQHQTFVAFEYSELQVLGARIKIELAEYLHSSVDAFITAKQQV